MRWRCLCAMAVGGRRCYMAATQPTSTWVRVVAPANGPPGDSRTRCFKIGHMDCYLIVRKTPGYLGGTTNGDCRSMPVRGRQVRWFDGSRTEVAAPPLL